MKFGLPIGYNILFWLIISLLRFAFELIKRGWQLQSSVSTQENNASNLSVAVCLPAYNEELVIQRTIDSLLHNVPANHIFVVSDGSTDRTAEIAREAGCTVLELQPGRGKAGALEAILTKFRLCEKFSFIIMADADTIFAPTFVQSALALFQSDAGIAAIAGYAKSPWRQVWPPSAKMYFIGYRARLHRVFQAIISYGQTWKYTNVHYVIPGFASIYRADVLRQLQVQVAGIIIEDFNLAFQVRRKKLGRIALHPSVYAIDQDPDNYDDYYRQITRWNVGFWQTVKHWGVWPSWFWFAQGMFIFEVMAFSLFLLFLPLVIAIVTFLTGPQTTLLFFGGVFLGIFLIDYLLTVIVAFYDRRYMMMFYGLGFLFLRITDAYAYLLSIPQAFRTQSTGRWKPPTRYAHIE